LLCFFPFVSFSLGYFFASFVFPSLTSGKGNGLAKLGLLLYLWLSFFAFHCLWQEGLASLPKALASLGNARESKQVKKRR